MKSFDKKFLQKNILIVSDFDDSYTNEELADEKEYIDELLSQIKEYGVVVEYVEVSSANDLKQVLKKYSNKDTIIFNWCERFDQKDGTEVEVVKVYEENGFIFTGGGSKELALSQDKYQVKQLLKSHGISTPNAYLVKKEEINDFNINFQDKYFVKSNKLHASIGIGFDNLVTSKDEFVKVANRLITETNTDLIVEQYIAGDEFTVVIWGNQKPMPLSILNITFDNDTKENIYTNNAKFAHESDEYSDTQIKFAELENETKNKINETVINAYKALGYVDYSRIDIIKKENKYYVIDANVNPYINGIVESEVFKSTQIEGYNYGETLLQICEFAFLRS